jgi:solute carrier family 13 (sodium-dependent dicarboxylate transporter), member 2/3/5
MTKLNSDISQANSDGCAALLKQLARIGLFLGPALFALILLIGPPQGMSSIGLATLALLVWMVVWWISEAVPIAMTALMPVALLPLLGASTGKQAASPYADEIIFLFIGGFILALSIERWNLHTRIALTIAGAIGSKPRALIAGFLLASALLSMWISNTATALMLMPTAVGVAAATSVQGKTDPRFAGALILAVAYAASIGGIGTPVGSPTNLIAMAYLERNGLALSFSQWMLMAVPIMLLMLLACWLILSWDFRKMPVDGLTAQSVLAEEKSKLGRISTPELRVLMIFSCVALAWMFRPLINTLPGMAALSDTGIAIFGALALFLIPAGAINEAPQPLMSWERAERLPWGVALLFGGGLSIAEAMTRNGVTDWLGGAMAHFGSMPPLAILLTIVVITVFATEFASNVATLTAMLPVVGAFSLAAGLPPLSLAFATSLAASLAFMMPIGTAPNAIAFGTGKVSIVYMLKVGFWLNLASIVCITLMTELLAPLVLAP